MSRRCITVKIECPYAVPCDSVDILCWCAEQFRKVKEPQVLCSNIVPITEAEAKEK